MKITKTLDKNTIFKKYINMSRSRKKKMGGGITTASSEKQYKKIWYKSFRSVNKTILKYYDADSEINLKTVKEISDPWGMDKDGKYLLYTELEIRSLVDVVINEISKADNLSRFFNGHGYHAIKIYRELCFYLKKKKKNMKQLYNIILIKKRENNNVHLFIT